MEITVFDRQNLLDVAVQYYGDAKAALDIAVANEINVTDDLIPGQKLTLPVSEHVNSDVLIYYQSKKIVPVTNSNIDTQVGYWVF